MLYLIHGKDFKKRKAQKDQLLKALRAKRPEAEVFTLEPEAFEPSALDELLYSQGLFEEKHIVVGSGLFTDAETKDIFSERLNDIAESPNVFLFLEDKLNKKPLEQISKHAEKVFAVGDGRVAAKKDNQAFFALADALGNKDKKTLWTTYQKNLADDGVSEEIHGIVFWQVKSMILARNAESAEAAGMKSFPYQKAKKFSKNFSDDELVTMSHELVALYHDAHRGEFVFAEGFERWILEL